MAPIIDGTAPAPAFDDWGSSSTVQTVRPREGESLEKIAHRLDVDPDALAEANPQVKDRQQVLTPFQEIRLPQELTVQKTAQAVPINQQSQSDQPPAPMGDTVANSAFKANLYATPMAAPAGAKREQWLAELARDPAEAHRAWKNLGGLEKTAVLAKMEKNYGKDFAQQFFQETKKGKPQFGTDNFQPGTGPTADQLKARGFRLGWTALGNGGVEVEHWVHPSGKAIDRDVSTWNPGATQTEKKSEKTTPTKIGPVKGPTPEEIKQKRAETLLVRLQDDVNQLKALKGSQPIPWDQVRRKYSDALEADKELNKLLGDRWLLDSNNADQHPPDMDKVDENFYTDADTAHQDLFDVGNDLRDRDPNFMDQPVVGDEPEEPQLNDPMRR